MRAGLLEEHIKILEPVIIKSDTGTETTTYQVKYQCRARKTYTGGDRENQNGDIVFTHHITFEIRRFYDFDELCRIEWDGQEYRILCIEKDKHNQSIKITTDLIND